MQVSQQKEQIEKDQSLFQYCKQKYSALRGIPHSWLAMHFMEIIWPEVI